MALSGKRVLVTGGSGFIGGHLVEELLRHGVDVSVLKRPTSDWPDHLSHIRKEIRLLQMDIQDARFESTLCDHRYDAVFHLAGIVDVPRSVAQPHDDFEKNVVISLRLLELLRLRSPDTSFINTSSVAVYGNPKQLPTPETELTNPHTPYAVGKLVIEKYVSVYSQLYQIPAVSLRFVSVYGPRQRKQVVYDLMTKLHAEPDTLTLLGNGTEIRDLIYVGDVVRAFLIALEHGSRNGEAYNVGTGQAHTIMHVAETIAQTMGLTPEIKVSGKIRAGDSANWCADITQIGQIGFSPQVELKQGIAETVTWLRNAG